MIDERSILSSSTRREQGDCKSLEVRWGDGGTEANKRWQHWDCGGREATWQKALKAVRGSI